MNRFIKGLRVLHSPGGATALLRYGVAASVEHRAALHSFDCHTVVDIGANRGQFALAARGLYPEAQIFSFEPLVEPAEKFKRVFEHDSQVRLFGVAVGAHSATSAIHISARDDSSSLLPIGKEQNRIFPGTQEVCSREVDVCRLDDMLSDEEVVSPALLKLDVQGFELEVLRGCEQLLPCFSWIYCECSFVELYEGQSLADEVIAWLRERGVVLRGVYNMSYDSDGKAVQADFLFRQV